MTIPVSTGLVRVYSEYMHSEYGDVDSDYVFVNLWSEPVGRPLTYDAVAKLTTKLRSKTGIEFNLHMLRHTAATEMIRAGVPIEIVANMLTHRSPAVTNQTYLHLDAEDLRAELRRAGLHGWDQR